MTAELIRLHFSTESWSFPICDEAHFRDLHRQFHSHFSKAVSLNTAIHIPTALSTFPALLFSVLAVALQFITLDSEVAHALDIATFSDCDRSSQWYIDTGQGFIEVLKHQKPTTTSIQYHLTKMAWLKNCGRGNEAWQALGVALRQAQEIDLHQIRGDSVQSPNASVGETLKQLWELEHRKRLWARIFIMDSHMAIALGRPRGIHREDCSTPPPLDCDYPIDPSQTVPLSTVHTHEPPNAFSAVIFSIGLGHKYHDLMSMRASKLDLKDYSSVQTIHQEVQSLLNNLPPALRPSFPDTGWDIQRPQLPALRQRLLTTTNIFLLALHRPYVSTHVASRYAATEAASEILQSQRRLFELVHEAQHKLYGYSFYTIDASIFLAAVVIKYPPLFFDTPARALQELQQATVRLGRMSDRSPLAKTGESVLKRCCAVVEARLPSAGSAGTLNGFGSDQLPVAAVDFLHEFGTRVPDQDTRELMALLANPATSTMLPTTTALPNGPFYGDPSMLPRIPTFGSDPTYTDSMSDSTTDWHFLGNLEQSRG